MDINEWVLERKNYTHVCINLQHSEVKLNTFGFTIKSEKERARKREREKERWKNGRDR